MKKENNMAQYIPKATVVAEIKKIYNEDYKFLPSDLVEGVQDFKDDLLMKLDTIEVKEIGVDFGDHKGDKSANCIIDTKTLEMKEVGLKKEVKKWKDEHCVYGMDELDFIFAKHFFELGMQVSDKIQKREI